MQHEHANKKHKLIFFLNCFNNKGALYCRECGVLVQDYDHLCPWTGTGIGKKNMWAFKGFVISVNILCYASVGIVIWALLKGFVDGEE